MKKIMCFLLIVFSYQSIFADPTPEPQTLNVIAFSGLKLRLTPDSNGKVIDIISFGERVEVLNVSEKTESIEWIEGSWVKVKYLEEEGFVFGGFLTEFPIPSENFELTQNDLDISYPLIAWAENNFDQIYESDTIERLDNFKIVDYLENNIVLTREESLDRFTSTLEFSNSTISEAYNLVRSLLLTKKEREVFEDKSLFIKNKSGEIDRIKINLDAPIDIKTNKDGSIKISVSSFHKGCGL